LAEDADEEILRALFASVFVRDGHVETVKPRPEFQPYLVCLPNKQQSRLTTRARRLCQKRRGGGLEGIRTPDLQRDRLAC
jgi:hypothetical protein